MRKYKVKSTSKENIDELTGLLNRRSFNDQQSNIKSFQKQKIPYSLVFLDIDNFKAINDTYGHLKADQVLRDFAQFITSSLGAADLVFRYGGDEFACFLPETSRIDTEQMVRRMINACRRRVFGGVKLTISAGITSFPEDGLDFQQINNLADRALFNAKRSGRDRIGGVLQKTLQVPAQVFVGRQKEKESMKLCLESNINQRQIVLVQGDIGIGKTRFVQEVLNNTHDREILWCDCLVLERIPYYPFRELIKDKFSQSGNKLFKSVSVPYQIEIAKLIPELSDRIDHDQSESFGIVLDKYRLLESIKKFLEFGTPKKVIVIDNIQRADQESSEIVKYLTRIFTKKPIIFVFIFRDEEPTDVLQDLLQSISTEKNVISIHLPPLSGQSQYQMLTALLGEEPQSDFARYIEQESDGNPLFIEEIVKELYQQYFLTERENKWSFAPPDSALIPKSLVGIFNKKYSALSNEGKEILEFTSVLGRFDLELIGEVTDYNEGHLLGIQDKLCDLGFLKTDESGLIFQDELTRCIVYNEKVSGFKRRFMHAQVARQLQRNYTDQADSALEELAYHYYHAVDRENGVDYCLKAAHQANQKYALNSAIIYFDWVNELIGNPRSRERFQLKIDCLGKRAFLHSTLGNHEQAEKDIQEALTAVEKIRDEKRRADIYYLQATQLFNAAQYQQAIDFLNQCLDIFEMKKDKRGMTMVMNALGNSYWRLGNQDQTVYYYQEALDNAKLSGDKKNEAGILNNWAVVNKSSGNYDVSQQLYLQALTLHRQLNDKVGEALILNNLGVVYKNMGSFEEALDNYNSSLKLARETGDKILEALNLNNIGSIFIEKSKYQKALQTYQEALHLALDIGDRYTEALVLNNLGKVNLHLGQIQVASTYLECSLKIKREIGEREGEADSLILLAKCLMHQGQCQQARRLLDDALSIAREIKTIEREFSAYIQLCEVSLALKQVAQAKEFLVEADELALELNSKHMHLIVNSMWCEYYLAVNNIPEAKSVIEIFEKSIHKAPARTYHGLLNLYLGRYYTEEKKYDLAGKAFQAALKIFNELHQRFFCGLTNYYWAVLESKQESPDKSNSRVTQATDIFNAVQAKDWIQKVDQIVAQSKSE